jgi:hypothetical protein
MLPFVTAGLQGVRTRAASSTARHMESPSGVARPVKPRLLVLARGDMCLDFGLSKF